VLRELVAWDTLHGEPASFVDPSLADQHSDLLYSAWLRTDPPEPLHVLLEHQSTADPAMPLRALSYRTRIWNRCRKQRPDAWLPPILTVLVSHVPGGWTTSRSLADMFDPGVLAIPDLEASVPRCSMVIEDLAGVSDDDLQARSLAASRSLRSGCYAMLALPGACSTASTPGSEPLAKPSARPRATTRSPHC
jgi:hypothetical protein